VNAAVAEDPFATLGLAPTLDSGAVRRAWMQAVKRHPPHADPEGFRRIRAAYDRLSRADGLHDAWLAAPFDAAAELLRIEAHDHDLRQRLQGEVAAHRQQARSAAAVQALAQQFGRVLGEWPLAKWAQQATAGAKAADPKD